jgi:hypothetical protein
MPAHLSLTFEQRKRPMCLLLIPPTVLSGLARGRVTKVENLSKTQTLVSVTC